MSAGLPREAPGEASPCFSAFGAPEGPWLEDPSRCGRLQLDLRRGSALQPAGQPIPGRTLPGLPFLTDPHGVNQRCVVLPGQGRKRGQSCKPCLAFGCAFGHPRCLLCWDTRCRAQLCLPFSVLVLIGAVIPRFQVMGILVNKCFPSWRKRCLWEPLGSHTTSRWSQKSRILRECPRGTGLKERRAGCL